MWKYLARRFAWIAFLIIMVNVSHASGSLEKYVDQYRDAEVPLSLQKKFRPHSRLIRYFTSLAYLKPRHVVDVDFLKALIIAESGVDPMARSVKDARGLTQLTYPTALSAAEELVATGYKFRHVKHEQLRNLTPDDLYDPAINLLIACYLLAKYNLKYEGRLDLVVAAWNAGEHSIKNSSPPRYRETLDLIGKVNGYYLSLLRQNNRLYASNG